MKKAFIPEALCSIDTEMSIHKLENAILTQTTVIGTVQSWDSSARHLLVKFTKDIYGYIPEEEISIYPLFKDNGVPSSELYSLIGKKVSVKVIGFLDKTPILSRKLNMQRAFENLQHISGPIKAYIKNYMPTAFFCDIGAGIRGILHVKDYTNARLKSITDLGNNPKDVLDVVIKEIDYEKQSYLLNYKSLFINQTFSLHPKDFVECTILLPVPQTNDGYFCTINPSTVGIINIPQDTTVYYGQKVIAIVRGYSKTGDRLKLNFLSFS